MPAVNPLVPGGRLGILGVGPARQERDIFWGLGPGPVYQLVWKCFDMLTTHVTVSVTCCLSALFVWSEGQEGCWGPGTGFLAISTIRKIPFTQSGRQVTAPTWPSLSRPIADTQRVPRLLCAGSSGGRLPPPTPFRTAWWLQALARAGDCPAASLDHGLGGLDFWFLCADSLSPLSSPAWGPFDTHLRSHPPSSRQGPFPSLSVGPWRQKLRWVAAWRQWEQVQCKGRWWGRP